MTTTGPNLRQRMTERVLLAMGALLIVIGVSGYFLPEGRVHWTALIPAILGVLALALSRAKSWPVAAFGGAALCAIALMGGGSALPQLPGVFMGEAGAAIASRAATALVAILALIGLALAWLRAKPETA